METYTPYTHTCDQCKEQYDSYFNKPDEYRCGDCPYPESEEGVE